MNLARLMGLFVDKHEVSGKDGGPLTLQALDSIVINTTINQQINISATPDRQQLPENVDTIEAIVSNNSRPVIDAELPLNI
jgi:hypothetical protein